MYQGRLESVAAGEQEEQDPSDLHTEKPGEGAVCFCRPMRPEPTGSWDPAPGCLVLEQQKNEFH